MEYYWCDGCRIMVPEHGLSDYARNRIMNTEKLRFVAGDTAEVERCEHIDIDDSGEVVYTDKTFMSEIHVMGEEIWMGRVAVVGRTYDDAEGLRDRLLWALDQPTVPAQWQASAAPFSMAPDEEIDWTNIDNGGEAARLKGKGYRVRALYTKQPVI
jgi:hypothetical protein